MGPLCAQPLLPAPTTCDSLHIRYIVLVGNRITRKHIVLRELGYAEGQVVAIKDTGLLFAEGRNRVFNTRLFVTVQQNIIPWGPPQHGCPQPVLVELMLKERWYLFPFPILELADRSINEWIYNRGADPSRINYGVRVDAYNLRGRNETLKLIGQLGFTRKLEASYVFPYLSKRLKEGLALEAMYSSNRQAAIRSAGNKQFFQENPGMGPLFERFRAGAEFSLRPQFWQTHRLAAGYGWSALADSIAQQAPDFFLDGKSFQRFFYLRYNFTYDRRDIRQYPLKGFYFDFTAERFGLRPQDDVQFWSTSADLSYFKPLGGRWFGATGFSATASTPMRQPYAQIRILGFSQRFVRGYERYVMESPVNVVVKNTVRYKLFQRTYQLKGMPLHEFSTFPLSLYLKGFVDGGYARNAFPLPDNKRLLNTLLLGTGVGLDIVTYYDYVLRLEYSRNRQGEQGFFIHVAVEL